MAEYIDKQKVINKLPDRQTINLIRDMESANVIEIPEGATNGDMVKAMFPSVEVKEKNNGYEVYFGIGTASQYFNHQWWNAPYKKGDQ